MKNETYNINDANRLIKNSEKELKDIFAKIDHMDLFNTERILKAFQNHNLADRHFNPSTGYGYGDVGRDTLESIFAEIFGTEDAIVRPQIASGTHALALCLFGLTLPGDHILSLTGKPYDTLEQVIGLEEKASLGSLKERGVSFSMMPLTDGGHIDIENISKNIKENTRLIYVQRSCGYEWRRTLLPEDMKESFAYIKKRYPHLTIMVDNCYGEFVCEKEPTHLGADLCAGSLIKNPGGGIAPTGGYIVGDFNSIEKIATCLTAPGVGKEIGSYAGSYQPFYQGLFLAPHVVAQALKIMVLAAKIFDHLGYNTLPRFNAKRGDIIQAIELGDPKLVIDFCGCIQGASPVDSMAVPEPWDMPGYSHKVIMAAGAFVSGSSIELSCDAPIIPPYIVYMQGGLTYSHGKIALREVLTSLTRPI